MTLADFTSPGLIVPHLRGLDAASVIQELSQAMQREKRVPDLLPFYEAALNSEFLVSNEMASGMAFPHARLPGLKELAFALGRSDEPLRWGAKAIRTVRLVFLLAVPATDSTQYLPVIAGLARLSSNGALVEKLQAATDNIGIFELIRQIELRTSPINSIKTAHALTRAALRSNREGMA